MPTLQMDLKGAGYPIRLERGALQKAGALWNLDRRVMIVTDSGVPAHYAQTVAAFCRESRVFCLPQGEIHKGVEKYVELLQAMVDFHIGRGDCLVAVGGGVVGDLCGFAAATYMRGIDFYTIPTTLLAQVDASVGGKTAIDFVGYKNLVGAFWQPRGVLIDPEVLKTLDGRLFSCGMAEIVKMFATSSEAMFCRLEKTDPRADDTFLDDCILSALQIKKAVVEQDEREGGLRRILNFGHTVGHGIESVTGLLHGESVGLGMLCVTHGEVRTRIRGLLRRFGLPETCRLGEEALLEAIRHDKKAAGQTVTAVRVDKPGSWRLEKTTAAQLLEESREVLELI